MYYTEGHLKPGTRIGRGYLTGNRQEDVNMSSGFPFNNTAHLRENVTCE